MRVLVRLDSLASPRTGIGYYTEHLVRELSALANIEIRGLYHSRLVPGEALKPLLQGPDGDGERGVSGKLRAVIRSIPGAYRTRQSILDWLAARQAWGANADLYHEPSFIPVSFAGPLVVTVHDMSHWRHPNHHPHERVDFLNRHLPTALDRASMIVAVSEFTRRELCAAFPHCADRTVVIHHGVDNEFRPRQATATHPVLSKWGLHHGGYILSVATLEPRKNLVGLVRAYAALPFHIRRTTPLVLGGGKGWKNRELTKLLTRLGRDSTVILTGRLSRPELVNLVSGAKLFAYPSFYEGFGLPIAEARASGVPVLTSDRGAMKEVAGEEAFLVDPYSNFAGELQAALEWAETHVPTTFRYSWEDTARKTVEVYRKVL